MIRSRNRYPYTNKTGAPSVAGSMVTAAAGGTDYAPGVALAGEYNAIGICETSGVADGGTIMVTTLGPPTRGLLKDGEGATAGYVVFMSDTAGRLKTAAVPAPPNSDSHFTECGHCHETVVAGTNKTVLFTPHFN